MASKLHDELILMEWCGVVWCGLIDILNVPIGVVKE